MKSIRYAILASVAVLILPSSAYAQCYQNGVPCPTTSNAIAGQPAQNNGTQIMGSDGTNNQTILTDTGGRIVANIYTLPALSTGTNTIGSIANTGFAINGTLPAYAATPTFNIGTAPTFTMNAQGSVTTASPSYTNATQAAFSLTLAGALRVDGSGVTQPISGTITANLGTLNGAALDTSVQAVKTALGTPFQAGGSIANTAFGISGTLPAFAATPTFNIGTAPVLVTTDQGSVTTAAPSYTNNTSANLSLTTAGALRVDGSGVTQPVSGTVTSNIGTTNGLALDSSLSGLFKSGQSIGNTVFGATQSGTWNVGLSAGTNSIGLVTNQGAVTTAAPSYTTGTTQSLSLTTAGALRIDGSGTTQAVSGTVTANIGTAPTLNVVNLAGTNSIGLTTGQAAVTTAAPAYTTGTTQSLSLTTTGGLRVDTSASNALRTIAFSETTTALGVGGTFTAGSHDAGTIATPNPYNYFTCFSYSDQAGTLTAQGSNDNSTFFTVGKQSTTAATATMLSTRIVTRYFRCSYVNGSVLQATFFMNAQLGQ